MQTLALASLASLSLFALAACAQEISATPTTPPVTVSETQCGPEIAGFDAVSKAPLVVLGEVHGQEGPPAFAANFACRQALRAGSATLALELPRDEQPRIDAFLASDGGDAAKNALLAGAFWQAKFQDGRRSSAMVAVLEKARTLRRAGLQLRVTAIDVSSAAAAQGDREVALAKSLVAVVGEKPGPVTLLVGNMHARTLAGASFNPSLEFMAGRVKKEIPDLVSLDVRYTDGEAWICTSAKAEECGAKKVSGRQTGDAWAIERFGTPDKAGFDGTYSVGAAKASEPARGLTALQ